MNTVRLVASQPGAVEAAAELLRQGKLVAFPTETVYGLGALGLDPEAVEGIFRAKQRPHSDPLILHVGAVDWVEELAREIPAVAGRLMDGFWPGPLTLVVSKADCVPDQVTAGSPGVAVRMPAHPVALELIRRTGRPVAAPSANLFSRPSPTTAAHVLEDLDGRIHAVLDGGPTHVGVESTVLDVRGPQPVILRPGGVTREQLESILGAPVLARGSSTSAPVATPPLGEVSSPGLLTKHYSPRAEVYLYDGSDEAVARAVRELAERAPGRLGILAFREDLPLFAGLTAERGDLGSRLRLDDAARRLYAAFRRMDELGISSIAVRLAPAGGIGDAINDRLHRAASGRVLRVP